MERYYGTKFRKRICQLPGLANYPVVYDMSNDVVTLIEPSSLFLRG